MALVLPPGAEYLVAYLAAAKVGAVTAGINDRLTSGERDAVLERATPRLVLAAPGMAPAGFDTVELESASGPGELHRGLRVDAAAPAPLPDDPDRPVAIVFTSGTTGIPKGALYGNRQLAFITANDVRHAWGGAGRGFTRTSLAHLGFMTKLPGNLRPGGSSHIPRPSTAP